LQQGPSEQRNKVDSLGLCFTTIAGAILNG